MMLILLQAHTVLATTALRETSSVGAIAWIALAASVLTPAVAAIKAWLDRRTKDERKINTVKTGSEAWKVDAEGQVAISGTTLAWAERADARAEKAETEARAARVEAREAYARADDLRRDRDHDREALNDLRREFDALLGRIASCPAGTVCPVADSLTRR